MATSRQRPLRIAYDVSFPASRLTLHDRKLGIIRVIEETLFGLLQRDEIEVAAVGLMGGDREPALTSGRAQVYQQVVLDGCCPHAHTYASRTGFSRMYERRFTRGYFAGAMQAAQVSKAAPSGGGGAPAAASPMTSLKRVARPVVRAIVRGAAALDTRVRLPAGIDIFHATHAPLPPRRVTGSARRLLTVYDLIPLLSPQGIPAAWLENFIRTFRSLDIRRDWAICISEFTKAELCRVTGMAPDRVFVAPLAADGNFRPIHDPGVCEAALRKYGIPQAGYLLTLCTPQPRKNLPHLVRCFAALVERRPDIRTNLVLVGARTPELEALQAQVGLNGREDIRSRIHFTGYVDEADLPALYSAAGAFIFPSFSEGFGLPPLEAMQCGIPVICSNAASLPEVVGDAAILIDPRDEAQLVAAMDRLLSSPALAQELRARGLERAKQFSWAATARKTIQAYKEIASA
jgi:glycosyltransferase involved in cell wall biosynthesis